LDLAATAIFAVGFAAVLKVFRNYGVACRPSRLLLSGGFPATGLLKDS
jgi:hypothetical protein